MTLRVVKFKRRYKPSENFHPITSFCHLDEGEILYATQVNRASGNV